MWVGLTITERNNINNLMTRRFGIAISGRDVCQTVCSIETVLTTKQVAFYIF